MMKKIMTVLVVILVVYAAAELLYAVKVDANDDCSGYAEGFDRSACEYFDVQQVAFPGMKYAYMCDGGAYGQRHVFIPLIGCIMEDPNAQSIFQRWYRMEIYVVGGQ